MFAMKDRVLIHIQLNFGRAISHISIDQVQFVRFAVMHRLAGRVESLRMRVTSDMFCRDVAENVKCSIYTGRTTVHVPEARTKNRRFIHRSECKMVMPLPQVILELFPFFIAVFVFCSTICLSVAYL